MPSDAKNAAIAQPDWHLAMPIDELAPGDVRMLRIAGKRIAFFRTDRGVRACDNRCPHEGYPLSEGSLSDECILTCNWHNWKFDLENGENLFGGDRLRVYPLEIRDEEIWIDLADPPFQRRYEQIVNNLKQAFDDYSYDRIAREIARLIRLGADPLDALRLSIDWSWQKLEFGWTHAYAGMADWLTLYHENIEDEELKLVCLVESVAHISYDVLRQKQYPYTEDAVDFDERRFADFIENENEKEAIASIRGGIQAGLGFGDFERALSRAALAHYNDFGHSLIYVTKAKKLIEGLGESTMPALLYSLVREMIYASREDRIPEFRAYHNFLEQWGQHDDLTPNAALWRKKSINHSMEVLIACSHQPAEAIYRALLLANAVNLLSFDIGRQDKIHVSVAANVGWLDFTHGLTFANAVHRQCVKFPELWPQALLQLACFNGRNAGFTTDEYSMNSTADPVSRIKQLIERIFDHGHGEHIVSVHLLKTALSVREEMQGLEGADAELLVASLQRFFDSPLKRRQVRRTAHQSLQFVAKE